MIAAGVALTMLPLIFWFWISSLGDSALILIPIGPLIFPISILISVVGITITILGLVQSLSSNKEKFKATLAGNKISWALLLLLVFILVFVMMNKQLLVNRVFY